MTTHAACRKKLVKLFEAVGREEGMRQYEVMRAFLEAGYRAIRGSTILGEAWERNEAEYMKLVGRCQKPQQTMARISEMLAVTVEALEARCADFLGPFFMEIGGSGDLGQFFTPPELSKLMAVVTIDVEAMIVQAPSGYFTAHEPAAGMGGMVLAVAELMREKGYDPARHCHWQMIDIEFNSMAGCYIQVSLAGVSGVVIQGDTLRLTQTSASITPTALLFPKRFEHAAPAEGGQVLPPAKSERLAKKPASQMAFDFSL